MRNNCPVLDDSEGITLRSLGMFWRIFLSNFKNLQQIYILKGGVFIATVVGLIVAMCTLAYEVYQQKKLEKAKVASDDTLATTTDQIKTIDIKPYKNDVDWFMKKTLESMAETTKFDAKLDAKYQTKY